MYQNVREFPVTDIISTESLQFCLGSRYSTRCYIMLYICITLYNIIKWKYMPHFNLFGMPSGSFGTGSFFWSIYMQHSLVGTHPSFTMLYTSSQATRPWCNNCPSPLPSCHCTHCGAGPKWLECRDSQQQCCTQSVGSVHDSHVPKAGVEGTEVQAHVLGLGTWRVLLEL